MVSSLIPPKIAVPNMVAGGKGGDPTFYSYMYSRLPKGPLPLRERLKDSRGLTRWMNHPDYGGKPYVIGIALICFGGYCNHYYRHFRHEKNNHH